MKVDLTIKQIKFCKQFLRTLDRVDAAKRAGVSLATVKKWMKQPDFKTMLVDEIKRKEDKIDISTDRVLKELGRLAFSDLTQVVKIKGHQAVISDTDEIPEDTRVAIGEIAETRDGLRIKMIDKKGALDSLARCLGMFIDPVKKEEAPMVQIGDE